MYYARILSLTWTHNFDTISIFIEACLSCLWIRYNNRGFYLQNRNQQMKKSIIELIPFCRARIISAQFNKFQIPFFFRLL